MKKMKKLVLALSLLLAIGTVEGGYRTASASEIGGKEDAVSGSVISEEDAADTAGEHGNETLDEGVSLEGNEPKTEEDFAEEALAMETIDGEADESAENYVSQEVSEGKSDEEIENAEEDVSDGVDSDVSAEGVDETAS